MVFPFPTVNGAFVFLSFVGPDSATRRMLAALKQKVVPRVEQLTAIRGGGRLENRDRGLAVLDFRGREELRIANRDLERAVGRCDAQLERDRVSLLDRQLIRIRPKTASAVIQRNRMV